MAHGEIRHMNLEVVILAAGKGTRMQSELPKVMHRIAGRPLLEHVLDTTASLQPKAVHIVVGYGANALRDHFADYQIDGRPVNWVVQEQQLGTGHAVLQALPAVDDESCVLVLYGDGPLIRSETLKRIVLLAREEVSLLTAEVPDPSGLGRILRNQQGDLCGVVEDRDASAEQGNICEINTGVLAAPAMKLKAWLPQVRAANNQKEYYLPDIIALATSEGDRIITAHPEFLWEIEGINDRIQLSQMERAYQARLARELMGAGVSLADPNRLDIRGDLNCGRDIFIDVNVVFEGVVNVADGVSIGANCIIKDSDIGVGCEIKSHSSLEGARLSANCTVGPYARLRPGTVLAGGVKIGNFVETKKASIGEGSKVSHLAYMGDSEIGAGVNVGAGTITCNYDGANKYPTIIGDGAFIGSNSTLVAPVEIEKNGFVGAGSTITKTVPTGELAVARSPQRHISNWQKPIKKQ
jgi:bifunctional UDP-N-acetylglucosamine pyrophosphorylase/glucosamine-1-phosphate N-acetyltransferase